MAALRLPVPRAVVSAPLRPAAARPPALSCGLRWQPPFGTRARHQRLPGSRSVAQTAAAGGAPDEQPPDSAALPAAAAAPLASSSSRSSTAGSSDSQPSTSSMQQPEQQPAGQQPVAQQQAGSAANAASGAASSSPGPAAAAAAASAAAGEAAALDGAPGAAAALATFFRVLGDTLRVLLRLLLVEPLGWVLNRCGLLAIRAGEVVAMLERTNRVAPLEPDRLAASLRVLNAHHPRATVEFVEKHCLSGGAGEAAGGKFAVNAAVVREYLTALVKTGRLSEFGDAADAAPEQGQSHRSLAQLLAELQAVAGGGAPAAAPGATLARPLHVIVQAQEKGSGFWGAVSSFLWTCVGMFAFFYVMSAGQATFRRFQGGSAGAGAAGGLPGGAAGVAASSREGGGMFAAKEYSKENLPEKSVKKFADVKGCDEAIGELQEIVEYLKRPEKFTKLGGKLPKGVLLTGPPGTGKTLLARAVAGEAGVPFFYKAGSEFDEMFVGVGSRRVRSLFAAAKKKAPCIIFIDEIDAMGGKRTNWESSGGSRKTLNQLLTDMDGFEENSGVVVMAATNLPELLDSALTRPGRFDRQVAVTLPDVKGRQHILDLYLTGKPVAADVDTDILARRTPGFSGAELANLVNEAALLAARHDSDCITTQLLDEARDKILMGTPRVLTQSEEARRLTAYHESGHALVALYTPGAKPIHKATIVPRGHALGMVSQVPEKDEYSITRQQLLADIDVCMGGKAAEELIFGEDHVTTGATSDLQQATRKARHMVVDCGMSERIGPVAVGQEQSPATRQLVDTEIQAILKGSYSRVVSLLKEKQAELHMLAQALLREETLTQADIKRLLAGGSSSPELPGSGPGGSGLLPVPAPAAAAVAMAGEAGVPAPAPAAAAAAAASPGLAASVGDPAAAAEAPPAAE
ncbi:hypothetical protein ABPG75_009482 [Micractinium tetrahymenae]